MRRALPGAAYVITLAQAPVVPVGIMGSTDDFLERGLRGKRPKIEMNIGKPFQLPPVQDKGEARRAARQRNADLIMFRIASLLTPDYRGVYNDAAELEGSQKDEWRENLPTQTYQS
jgi:1-acyl-sn-glycerol-3-phosphate acyltransferase